MSKTIWLRMAPLIVISTLLISCGGGSSGTGGGGGGTVSVSVSPLSVNVAPGATASFSATVTGTSNTAVNWSAGGVQSGNSTFGTISSSGLYTAPATVPNPSAVTITATSVADPSKSGSGTANVIVHHDNQDPQSAPIKLGTSGGNATDKVTSGGKVFCCSGTLGSLISRGGNLFILSNNHVLDKSDQGAVNDPISQPGLAEDNCGTNPSLTVAHMSQAAPLKTSNVDAAMAQIVAGQVDTSGTILDLAAMGTPAAPSATLATASLNEAVAKSGDATGLTCSSINATNVDVRVDYSTQCQGGTTFTVTFTNQISIVGGNFSNSGDSGSLIVDSGSAQPVALLYAGSSTGTVGSPIQDVLTALKDPNTGEVPKMVGGGNHAIACPATGQSQVIAEQRSPTRIQVPEARLEQAKAVKNLHAAELMQDPAVTGVGVGQSDDNAQEPAIVIFTKDHTRKQIPAEIGGVRTKVIAGSEFRPESAAGAAALSAIADSEVARVRNIKQQHAHELMGDPAILGVGVGASNDDPSQAAVVVFIERGKRAAVPAEIDGARTRVIVTDRFRTFDWGKKNVAGCRFQNHLR